MYIGSALKQYHTVSYLGWSYHIIYRTRQKPIRRTNGFAGH